MNEQEWHSNRSAAADEIARRLDEAARRKIDAAHQCPACAGDGGWPERVDETSNEVVWVTCSTCKGSGRR